MARFGASHPSGASIEGCALERIRLLVELGRPKEALALIARSPRSAAEVGDLAELEALALIRLGEWRSALEATGCGLRQEPERAHLHYLRWFAQRAAGEQEATASLLEALRLAPLEPVYLRAYAESLSDQKRHTEALIEAQAAVRVGPDRAANHVTLGFVASAAGDKKLARASYERALALDPEDASAWNNLGCLDLEAGQAGRARARFRESLRIAPEGTRAQKNLAQTLTGRRTEGYTTYGDWVRALGDELLASRALRLLAALAIEDEEARAVVGVAASSGVRRQLAALLGISAWTLWGFAGARGALLGASLSLVVSASALRLLDAERRRVRAALAEAQPTYAAIRAAWLDGKMDRSARDAAARALVERISLMLTTGERP